MTTEVQSVLLDKAYFSYLDAITWVHSHGFALNKLDITRKFYRFKQHDPNKYVKLRTKEVIAEGNGVNFVFGVL